MSEAPKKVSVQFLLANYEVLLIDAFGVLMNSVGALPGAVDFINLLNRTSKPYYILSNGTLYNAEQNQGNYARRGLSIPKERILTSGMMIGMWLPQEKLQGKRFLVLGPEPTKNLIRDAGGVVTEMDDENPDVLVLGDQTGFDLLAGIDHAITLVFRSIEKSKPLRVLVPNPDVIYPKAGDKYGITAGALALILKRAVDLRFPHFDFQMEFLGKPYTSLYEEARRHEPKGRMIMLGDQIETDIRGAHNFGIDSVLMGTGVTRLSDISGVHFQPTYIMDSLLDSTTQEKV